MSSSLADWRQSGEVYFWRYKNLKEIPGYNISADPAGSEDLLALLSYSQKGSRLIHLSSVPNILLAKAANTGTVQFSRLRIAVEENVPRGIDISQKNDECHIKLDFELAEKFASGIRDLKGGGGDWCLSDRAPAKGKSTNKIWFWSLSPNY